MLITIDTDKVAKIVKTNITQLGVEKLANYFTRLNTEQATFTIGCSKPTGICKKTPCYGCRYYYLFSPADFIKKCGK